jgi:hypothetical protein
MKEIQKNTFLTAIKKLIENDYNIPDDIVSLSKESMKQTFSTFLSTEEIESLITHYYNNEPIIPGKNN